MSENRIEIARDLELLRVDEKYAPEAFEVVLANYAYLHRWMPWATDDYTAESAAEFFRSRAELMEKGEGADFCIFLEGRFVGGIGYNNFDISNRSAEIGYWLSADKQGRGIATRSCTALLDLAFSDFKLNRIAIRCALENFKSRSIPERLGFNNEGIARQAELLHGEFFDLVVYSMLAEEWVKIGAADRLVGREI